MQNRCILQRHNFNTGYAYTNSMEEGLHEVYTNYTAEFKLDVLNFMAQSGISLMDTAAIFMIPSFTTVYQWKKQFEVGGLDALEPKKKGRPSMKNKTQNMILKDSGRRFS